MSMTRLTKIIGFSVPPVLADEVEQIAREERRTKSELFREMLRVYRSYRKKQPEPAIDDAWVMQVIREAQEEQRRNPMTQEEVRALDERLTSYGEERLKALGITSEEEINDIVYEERQKHRQAARRS
jgi:metal-responsive CopG/Arc/MetJ family transcriptional regulator